MRNIVQRGCWKIKIRRLAPIAIACLALLMPRLVFTGDTVGGAILNAKPDCLSKSINYHCAGTLRKCAEITLVTVEETSNAALQHFKMGTTVQDCNYQGVYSCTGKANNAIECPSATEM